MYQEALQQHCNWHNATQLTCLVAGNCIKNTILKIKLVIITVMAELMLPVGSWFNCRGKQINDCFLVLHTAFLVQEMITHYE